MPPSSLENDLHALEASLANLRALLLSFQTALQSPLQPQPPITKSPNPLALLSDASKLLKAQTTKLSLLILNKPFSPKEVTFIVTTLTKSVLPALLSGLELCPPERYTRVLHEHVKVSLGVLWREMFNLLDSVPVEGKDVGVDARGKDALASTGVLWDQCDALTRVGEGGLVNLVDGQVKAYGALLEDAIAELDEWDPDESDNDDSSGDEGNDSGDAAGIDTPTTSEDERLGSGMQKLNISPQNVLKGRILKHLRLIKMLYPALRKQRIATFPNITKSAAEGQLPSAEQIEMLDALVTHMRQFTDDADEIAGAIYADNADEVKRILTVLVAGARACVEVTRKGWEAQDDEYTAWIAKWIARLNELSGG